MARRPYGRSRRRRRGPGQNRWRYVAGIVVLVLATYFLFFRGSDPSETSLPVAGDSSEETNVSPTSLPPAPPQQDRPPATLVQASEFAPVVDTPSVLPPQPKASAKGAPLGQTGYDDRIAQVVQESISLANARVDRLVEVRTRLNDTLLQGMAEDQRALVKDAMSRLADKWLFSRKVYPGDTLCETYQVQRGNRLERIGRKYQVPYQLLMEINGFQRDLDLKAGARIKVVKGPFHAKVYRSTYTMDIYLQQTFVKSYRVGLGLPGRQTPTGTWLATSGGKMIKPQWTDPETGRIYHGDDPDYPLGSRWIALQGLEGEAVGRTGFAIHGTKEPETIGTDSSRGCVRLHNGDVIEVFNLLQDGVSKVVIYE